MKVVRRSPRDVPPIGAYSQVARVESGDTVLLFISGQVAVDERGEVVGKGDFRTQAERTLENLRRVLASEGATADDVLKVTVFLRDMGDRAALRDIRARFFPGEPPASTAVEVSRLAHDDLLLEIEAVAALPLGRRG